MSDWLSIIIVILIVGIVLDGVRRARNSRKNELRLSKNARKVDQMYENDSGAGVSSELPFGGARTKESTGKSESRDNPVQEALEFEEPVPMLMDTIVQAEPETQVDEDIYLDEQNEPKIGELSDLDSLEESIEQNTEQNIEPNIEQRIAVSARGDTPRNGDRVDSNEDRFVSDSLDEKTEGGGEDIQNTAPEPTPEEILIINIMAKKGEIIPGDALLDAFTTEKLKYGQMGVFHRHLDNDGDGPVIYSVANIVEPGSFDFSKMKNSETPGVCIFLALPTAGNAITAYDDMVTTARTISAKLGCELSDENRSILTKQAIEHGRQRVIEFERKNKLKKQLLK